MEKMWDLHPGFPEIITQVWKNNPTIENAVNFFAPKASEWACTNICNIFNRKHKLLHRIKGIQQSANYYYSSFLQNREKELITDLKNILKMEEDY